MYNEREQQNRLTPPKQNDQIDLRDVFKAIGEGFQKISRFISYLITCIKKRIVPVVAVLLLSIALGYAAHYISKPYYNSSMTLVLANIRNEFIEDQLNKLSEMIEDNNFEAVAERLDITPGAAREIRAMKFINLDQDRIAEDSVLTGSPFRIEISIYNPQLFDILEPGITNYLENNRYFARQKQIKQRQVASMISKLKGEITSIDSLKTTVSEPRGPVNGFVYGQPIDPTNLYRESISMYKEQVDLEADLEKLANVEIVTGFIPRLKPTGPRLRYFLAVSGLLGLLLGTIVAVNLEKKKMKRSGIAS